MKSELCQIPGKGICIVISDFDMKDLDMKNLPVFNTATFRDVLAISNELRACRKIGAIKKVREQTGWSLKEAKHYIDTYTTENWSNWSASQWNNAADQFERDHQMDDFLDSSDMEI